MGMEVPVNTKRVPSQSHETLRARRTTENTHAGPLDLQGSQIKRIIPQLSPDKDLNEEAWYILD